jgi:pSer/pThr/pTyr-binding forkhead associated (FHA) protein
VNDIELEQSHGAAVESLVYELNSLRRAAGNPSLGQLVRLSQDQLARATLDDHLSGRRKRLPPWPLVSAYVRACHDAATATGLDARQLGTIDEWKARWTAALEGTVEAASPLRVAIGDHARTGQQPLPVGNVTSSSENSKRLQAERPTMIAGPNSAAASIAPVLQQLEDKVSKRAQSLPSHTGLLVVTNSVTIGTIFEIEHNLTTIGRNPANDIWLNDPTVSRSHALIQRHGDQFFVEDFGSSNGTLLHGAAISEKSPLPPYSELRIGVFIFLFIQGTAAPGEAASPASFWRGPLLPQGRLEQDIDAKTDARFPPLDRSDAEQFSPNEDGRGTTRRGRWLHRPPTD